MASGVVALKQLRCCGGVYGDTPLAAARERRPLYHLELAYTPTRIHPTDEMKWDGDALARGQ